MPTGGQFIAQDRTDAEVSLVATKPIDKVTEVVVPADLVRAHDPKASWAELDALTSSPSVLVRSAVAANPRIDATLIALLSHDEAVEVRVALAQNPRISREMAERFSNDREPSVRLAVLTNTRLRTRDVMLMMRDEETQIAAEARAQMFSRGRGDKIDMNRALVDDTVPSVPSPRYSYY